jgi:hypothetical protein
MGDSAHTALHTNPGEKTAPPLFLFLGDEIYMEIYTSSHILEKNTSEHPLPDLRPDLES